MGTGYNQGENSVILSDFYRFDPKDGSWTRLGDFPDGARGFSYAVTSGGKAYVGFGIGVEYDSSRNRDVTLNQSDLWEYNPETDTWKELAQCPCLERYHPAFVSTEDKLFVGLGSSARGNLNDWWEYDIASDTWTEKPDFPGLERHHPFYFSIDSLAYVGFGHGRSIYKDFYRYNPRTETWTEILGFPGESRVAGTQFSHRGKGYILSGQGSDHENLETGEFWEFDPLSETWSQLPPHEGTGRWAPASFIVEDTLYFGTGYTNVELKDMWKYPLPGAPAVSVSEVSSKASLIFAYPNPTSGNIQMSGTVQSLSVYDLQGSLLMEKNEFSGGIQLNLPSGTYVALITALDGTVIRQRLVLQQ